jgi:hypothetical protein
MSEEAPETREEDVRAAARVIGLDLTPEQVARVSVALARNAEMAALVMALALPDGVEPAAIFRP